MEKALESRIITALAMLGIFLGLTFFASDAVYALVLGLLTAVAGWEWSLMAGVRGERPRQVVAFVYGLVALFCLTFWAAGEPLRWILLAAAVFWLGVLVLLTLKPVRDHLGAPSLRLLVTGLFVCVAAVTSIQAVRSGVEGHSSWLILYVCMIIWSMDTGAYFVGRRFGRTKLAPSISPGKTREGVYGGLAFAFVMHLLSMSVAGGHVDGVKLLVATLLAAAVSIVGDLYESRMKRGVDLKDSGHILPGHGGLLDRLDGIIAAVPVFAFLWVWL